MPSWLRPPRGPNGDVTVPCTGLEIVEELQDPPLVGAGVEVGVVVPVVVSPVVVVPPTVPVLVPVPVPVPLSPLSLCTST